MFGDCATRVSLCTQEHHLRQTSAKKLGEYASRTYAENCNKSESLLHKSCHGFHADRFAAGEWFAVAAADGLAEVRRLVAQAVEKSRGFCWSARDELAFVATNRRELGFPLVGDVEHERRLNLLLEMHAVVIEDSLRVKRLAREIGLGELRPKAGRID